MDKYLIFLLFVDFKVRILDELACRAHFTGKTHFAYLRFGTLWGLLKGLKTIFGGIETHHQRHGS